MTDRSRLLASKALLQAHDPTSFNVTTTEVAWATVVGITSEIAPVLGAGTGADDSIFATAIERTDGQQNRQKVPDDVHRILLGLNASAVDR